MYRIVEDSTPPIPPGLPQDLDHFLTLCFRKEPRARPTAKQLFGHPWLLKHCPELVSHHTLQPCRTPAQSLTTQSMLRSQDSIPFLRRVSTDSARPRPQLSPRVSTDGSWTPPTQLSPRVSMDGSRIPPTQLSPSPQRRPTRRPRPVSFAVSTLSKPDTDSSIKRLSFSESTKPSRDSLVKTPQVIKTHQLVKTTFAKGASLLPISSMVKAY